MLSCMKNKIDNFIASQKSIHLYQNVQEALREVFSAMSASEFDKVTKNLILMVLHDGALGQAMHFSQTDGDFKVVQLTVPKEVSQSVLQWVIAHEFGHVLQGRNWQESDGTKLENDADKQAEKWLKGEDLDIKDTNDFKIIKNNNKIIGCGKSTTEQIKNFVPKERRIKN